MAYGYWGKILRVNLSTGDISVDEHNEKFYRTYLGGKGIISHYLLKEVTPGCDPLGPDNVLVFAASVLTGTGIPGSARNSAGGLPTRNFKEGSFEDVEAISGRFMTDTILVDRSSCYACPVHCKRVVEVNEKGLTVSRRYSGPEYETITAFGSNCGINDLKAIAKANEICDAYTIDTIGAGIMVSGAIECAERGLLPQDLISDLDLRFGSPAGMLKLLNQMVQREGLGDMLAEGPQNITDKLGEEAAACFMHVKGQPFPLHEPRWKTGMGIGYALSVTGAEHMTNIHDNMYASEDAPTFAAVQNMGILESADSQELSPRKARLWIYMMLNRSIHNHVGICSFMPYSLDQILDQVKGVTGWNASTWELMKISERSFNMARAFNAREGFTSEEDVLPERCFEPMAGGILKGQFIDRQQFYETRNLIYDMLGWESQSASPKRWKLYELGLDWLVEDLAKQGILKE